MPGFENPSQDQNQGFWTMTQDSFSNPSGASS
jgi:hypothetical protein